MATPRRISPPGSIHKITRRTAQGQFLLRPDEPICAIIWFVLGVLQEKFRIEVHVVTVLSNHIHLEITDVLGDQLQHFNREFFSLTARAINEYRGRSENLWSSEKPNCVLVAPTLEDQAAHLKYVILNAVDAQLVATAKEWPGVRVLAEDLGRLTITTSRPKRFFNPKGPMPDSSTVVLTLPKVWDASPEELRTRVIELCAQGEKEMQAAVEERSESFLGVAAILEADIEDKPDQMPRFSLIPHVACKDPKLRLKMLKYRKRMQKRYDALRRSVVANLIALSEVIYPEGTFAAHFFGGAAREPWGDQCLWKRLALED